MRSLLVAALLWPSVALAQVDNTAIACGTAETYYPYGHRWNTAPYLDDGVPIIPYGVGYIYHTTGTPDVSGSTEQEAINRAAATWTNFECAANEFPSMLILPADTSATFEIDVEGDNYITWIESQGTWDTEIQGSSSTIAMTLTSSILTGAIVDADMAFNGINYQFRAHPDGSQTFNGCASSGTGSGSCYDVEAIALHEFGHFIGFSHVQCPDAVMYPNGTPSGGLLELTEHEAAGLCELYPPRDPDPLTNEFGELCEDAFPCSAGLTCLIAPQGEVGWCTYACTTDASCNVIGEGPTHAYKCKTVENADGDDVKVCLPGLRAGGGAAPVDPEGDSLDLCAPCTDGNQCANGVCVSAAEGETGICTLICGGEGLDTPVTCPDDMDCLETSTGPGVCWPSGSTCGGGGGGGDDGFVPLNEACYLRQGQDEQFAPCDAGLICAIFKPGADDTQQGACVNYCSTGQSCPDDFQTCCFGIDDAGHCVTAGSSPHGGCFEVQNEGEPCVMPEQSICQDDMACIFFTDTEDPSLAKCYQLCSGSECDSSQTCFDNEGAWDFGLCCDSDDLDSDFECHPGESDKLPLGYECNESVECDSQECLRYDGDAACTRSCNAVTQTGCPGDVADVDGDGRADGGFACVTVSGEGKCWPKEGPLAGNGDPPSAPADPGCACRNAPGTSSDWLLAASLWALGLWRLVSGRTRRP